MFTEEDTWWGQGEILANLKKDLIVLGCFSGWKINDLGVHCCSVHRAIYVICHRVYAYVCLCMYIDMHDTIISP